MAAAGGGGVLKVHLLRSHLIRHFPAACSD